MANKKNIVRRIKSAVISVSDKSNLKPLLQTLNRYNVKLISSGGTFKAIRKLGYRCLEVSDYTGFNEILDGRVKTLHPKIHAGILNKRNNNSHKREIKKNNFQNIDLVIVNFYPFEKTLNTTKNHNKIIEKIDIGGPALVRSAAKNYNDVAVITSTNQYSALIDQLKRFKGATKLEFRKKLSQSAFNETAYYDSVISDYFNSVTSENFTEKKIIYGNLIEKLRYGENPHQISAIYSKNKDFKLRKIHGKQLSYNNYNDIFAGLNILLSTKKIYTTVIIKHANPCGVAINNNQVEAYKEALKCDSTSAFGGIISFNSELQAETAELITEIFTEVIIAPTISEEAKNVISKKKNLRLLSTGGLTNTNEISHKMKTITGGFLVQTNDNTVINQEEIKIVSKRKPNDQEVNDLYFAFTVAKHVKSNAIVYAKNGATVGIGAGQMNRLDSSRIAARKSEDAASAFGEKIPLAVGSVVASDAFFPFADGLIAAAEAGVTAIIQPGGSIRDEEVIQAADEAGLAMIFTGLRHFNH